MPWYMCGGQKTTCINWFFPPREKTEAIKLGGKCLYLLIPFTGLYFPSCLMCPRIASSCGNIPVSALNYHTLSGVVLEHFYVVQVGFKPELLLYQVLVYRCMPPCPAPWLLFISFHALDSPSSHSP